MHVSNMLERESLMSDIKMDDIVSLSKRRGFIFPGSEIYGGEAGLYDFGPYGVELLNNIKIYEWGEKISSLLFI